MVGIGAPFSAGGFLPRAVLLGRCSTFEGSAEIKGTFSENPKNHQKMVSDGVSWASFGRLLGPLGGPMGPLGCLLRSLGVLLKASWDLLELSWGRLGASRPHLGVRLAVSSEII